MKAIVRRLIRLEDRFVPREDEQSQRLRERLRNARRRYSKSIGQPYYEPPDHSGQALTFAECILASRARARGRAQM